MRKDPFTSLGEEAARILAQTAVDDPFLDDTGRPLSVDDRVTVMDSKRWAGRWGIVVGLDELDDGTGEPKGHNCVFVRLDNEAGLILFHPARLRYTPRA